ncbi:hypothetical protein BLA29_011803 [Euroglyphus maynei]|uniref:Uncharacterized protein n=1 Tax=Euroglyphus maynei TaxID=6958 RepID=A0A1Y3BLF8_EURMA|nr:hypothetical protein BLA29_011803 [Euroglyphus maynei]
MFFGSSGTGSTSSAVTGSSSSVGPENYSSFFLKRRPMVVAGAMNAVNVMMMSKNSSNTTGVSGSGSQTTITNDQSDSGTGQSGTIVSSTTGNMSNQSGTLQPPLAIKSIQSI